MSNKSYIPTMTISTKVSPDIGFTDEQVNQCDVPVVIIKKLQMIGSDKNSR